MTWEVALIGMYAAASFAFMYMGANMSFNTNAEPSRFAKYGKIGLFLIGFIFLLGMAQVGDEVLDAQALASEYHDPLNQIVEGTYVVLLVLFRLAYSITTIMVIADILLSFMDRRKIRTQREEAGVFE